MYPNQFRGGSFHLRRPWPVGGSVPPYYGPRYYPCYPVRPFPPVLPVPQNPPLGKRAAPNPTSARRPNGPPVFPNAHVPPQLAACHRIPQQTIAVDMFIQRSLARLNSSMPRFRPCPHPPPTVVPIPKKSLKRGDMSSKFRQDKPEVPPFRKRAKRKNEATENKESKKSKYARLDCETWRKKLLDCYNHKSTKEGRTTTVTFFCNGILKEPHIRSSFSERWKEFGGDDLICRGLSPDHPEVKDALERVLPGRTSGEANDEASGEASGGSQEISKPKSRRDKPDVPQLRKRPNKATEKKESKKAKYVRHDSEMWRKKLLDYYSHKSTKEGRTTSVTFFCNGILKEPQIRRSFSDRWTQFGGDDFIFRGLSPDHPEVKDAFERVIPGRKSGGANDESSGEASGRPLEISQSKSRQDKPEVP
jgi:hypothetical protein